MMLQNISCRNNFQESIENLRNLLHSMIQSYRLNRTQREAVEKQREMAKVLAVLRSQDWGRGCDSRSDPG